MQASETALDIPASCFDLNTFKLIDTNLDTVTDLSWYLTLPPEQLALFILHDSQYALGLQKKQSNAATFNFNVFVKELM